jgi:hypothetical protein
VRDVECRATKGRREKDGRELIPGSGSSPLSRPKVVVRRGIHLLEADHVGRVVAQETEDDSSTIRGGHALDVESEDLKR